MKIVMVFFALARLFLCASPRHLGENCPLTNIQKYVS